MSRQNTTLSDLLSRNFPTAHLHDISSVDYLSMVPSQSSQVFFVPSDHHDVSDPIFYDTQIEPESIPLVDPPNSGMLAYVSNQSSW